ncbi:MAG: hypothetical protein KID09_13905, partial [Paenibacillus macerans]|uniref:hypothetical protein n=1 Tax=Paenibacillus macerans TaxID=44252 RepID=UPI002431A9C4
MFLVTDEVVLKLLLGVEWGPKTFLAMVKKALSIILQMLPLLSSNDIVFHALSAQNDKALSFCA